MWEQGIQREREREKEDVTTREKQTAVQKQQRTIETENRISYAHKYVEPIEVVPWLCEMQYYNVEFGARMPSRPTALREQKIK